MRSKCIYFLLGAFTVITLRVLCDYVVKKEDQHRAKMRLQEAYAEEDLEMLDEDIYAEEW